MHKQKFINKNFFIFIIIKLFIIYFFLNKIMSFLFKFVKTKNCQKTNFYFYYYFTLLTILKKVHNNKSTFCNKFNKFKNIFFIFKNN